MFIYNLQMESELKGCFCRKGNESTVQSWGERLPSLQSVRASLTEEQVLLRQSFVSHIC